MTFNIKTLQLIYTCYLSVLVHIVPLEFNITLHQWLSQGSSGSPVFNQNGLLIGVVSFGLDYGCDGLSGMVSVRKHLPRINFFVGQSEGTNSSTRLGEGGDCSKPGQTEGRPKVPETPRRTKVQYTRCRCA